MTISQDSIVGALATRYAKHPGIRALLKLLPGGGSADGLLQARADQIRQERLRYFFDELASGHVEITSELIQSNDFLHCYFKTAAAAVNSRRREKAELFARMLCASLKSGLFSGLDQYEELVDALDSMTLREFGVLKLLKEFESEYALRQFETGVARIQAYWKEFQERACALFEIEPSEIDPFLERLQRTGLYTRNTDAFWDSDPRIGKTTRQFEKLCLMVQENAA